MFEWHKKEAPVFTGVTRGVGGFGFGKRAAAAAAAAASIPTITATGGSKIPSATSGNGYVYHLFTSPGDSLIVSSGTANIEYLVVGGGGGGGTQHSGAGGAGGLRTNDPNSGPGGPSPVREPNYPIIPGSYPVVVGPAGAGASPGPNGGCPRGGNGSYSSFNDTNVNSLGTIRSEGGGGGGSWDTNKQGAVGGSGGGSSGAYSNTNATVTGNRVAGSPSSPVPNQGYPSGATAPGDGAHAGSGGGGAGGAGGNASGTDHLNCIAGPGGPGKACPAFPGPLFSSMPAPWQSAVGPTGLYAGGGGAGQYSSAPSLGRGVGGPGGGGDGAYTNGPNGSAAISNTGGGGGGGNQYPVFGGNGGTGIVIIRYLG